MSPMMTAAGPAQILNDYEDLRFGATVRIARGAAGLTQAQLAPLARMTRQGLSRIEPGVSPHDPWERTVIARGIVSSFGGQS